MFLGLVVILLMVFLLPFFVKQVEANQELFLLVMGLLAALVSGLLNHGLIRSVLSNQLLYLITLAVLLFGVVFKLLQPYIRGSIRLVLRVIPLRVFVFLVVILLGLFSSMVTAIIASLVLVEIINNLPLNRRGKISLTVIACFAIGLGAVLTPLGEPLATIVTSRLNQDFWYLMKEIGLLVVPGVIALGLLGGLTVQGEATEEVVPGPARPESYREILFRAVRVFIFVLALEFLGAGFKPLVDNYLISLDGRILYPINMVSAVLDNATLASAEISFRMDNTQIGAIIMGLLISGGMLIPGNIPNIISAGKLKISSREWASLGMPLGLVGLVLYYVVLFVIQV